MPSWQIAPIPSVVRPADPAAAERLPFRPESPRRAPGRRGSKRQDPLHLVPGADEEDVAPTEGA